MKILAVHYDTIYIILRFVLHSRFSLRYYCLMQLYYQLLLLSLYLSLGGTLLLPPCRSTFVLLMLIAFTISNRHYSWQ